jgi:uncharacterized membrane protein YciS (DUF1049 family)
MIANEDFPDLMIIYGIGAESVFFVLMLMYRYALKQANDLELNELEKFDTRTKIRTNLLMGIIPLISVLLAVIFRKSWMVGMISGFTYLLYTPVMVIHGRKVKREREKFKNLQIPERSDSHVEG